MGQRLNVEIIKNGVALANAYYHWSGYTSSSLEITNSVLSAVEEVDTGNDIVTAIKLLEATGSGLTDQEMLAAKDMIKDYDSYALKPCTNRNNGLTAISDAGIEDTRRWEEARVEINIDTKVINFKAVYEGEDEDELEYDVPDLTDKFDFEISSIPFDRFPEFATELLRLDSEGVYSFNLGETTYGLIA